jgi:Mrp family chromosome partitioning ATPase
MIARLRTNYDYIILDLPPVGEVSDSLAVTKLTDGMLVVVRQNYCDRVALNAAIRQFEFVDAKILGVVFNCTSDNGGKGYYKKYYKKYYKGYAKSYENNDRAVAATSGKKGE